MTDIVVRWSGPTDATADSTYKIERTTDNVSWTVLDATQASTTPYASDTTTLALSATYGAATITLTSGTAFPDASYIWLDDALVQYTGKSTNDLTGCVWHSGYGTYAALSTVREAHESFADTATISLNAVLYRVTHTDVGGNVSAPTYIWYYSPPAPESSSHCVVVVNMMTDLGWETLAVNVSAEMSANTSFGDLGGEYISAGQSADKTVAVNAFGLAFFQCWKSSKRSPVTGSDAAYTFVLYTATAVALTCTVSTIPDRDWILLNQITTSAV